MNYYTFIAKPQFQSTEHTGKMHVSVLQCGTSPALNRNDVLANVNLNWDSSDPPPPPTHTHPSEEFPLLTISYCHLTEVFDRTTSYCGLTEEFHRTDYFTLWSYRRVLPYYFTLWSYRRVPPYWLLSTVVLQKNFTILFHTVVLQKSFTVLFHTVVLQKSSAVLLHPVILQKTSTSYCGLTEDFYFILWSYRRLLIHTVVLWKSSTVLITSYCGLTELVHTVVLQKSFTVLTTSYSGLTELVHTAVLQKSFTVLITSYCGLTELVHTVVLQKSSIVLATSFCGLTELVHTAVLQKSSTVLTTSYCGLTELVHTAVLQKSSTVLTCSAVSIRVNPLVPAQQHGLAEGDRPPVHHDRAQNAEEAVRVVGLLLDLGPYLAAPAAHEEDGAGPEGQALARQLQRLALVHPQLRLRFVHIQGHVVPLVELGKVGWKRGAGLVGLYRAKYQSVYLGRFCFWFSLSLFSLHWYCSFPFPSRISPPFFWYECV